MEDILFLLFFLFWRSEGLHQTHRPHQKWLEFTQLQRSEIGHLSYLVNGVARHEAQRKRKCIYLEIVVLQDIFTLQAHSNLCLPDFSNVF